MITIVRKSSDLHEHVRDCVVVVRGDVYRGSSSQQEKCINAMIDNLIRPLIHANVEVSVALCCYSNKKLNKIIKIFLKIIAADKLYDFSYDKTLGCNQVTNFLTIFDHDDLRQRNLLILRADIALRKPLHPSTLLAAEFSFQWNCFHDTRTLEIADQIHFIGNDCYEDFRAAALDNPSGMSMLPDGTGAGTLHNLYNFCKSVGIENLGYLYHYDLSPADYVGSFCLLRGNANKSSINDLFTYEKDPMFASTISRVGRKLSLIFRNMVPVRR